MKSEIEAALNQGLFEPAFQPVARLSDGALAGFEALARWRRKDGSILGPEGFLNEAIEAGLMGEVSSQILAASCKALGRWREKFTQASGLFVAVNISGRDLERVDIVREALETVIAAGLPPGALKLEITEQQVIRDPRLARRTLGLLREGGIAVAFDDFGAGFNSLRWLADLPADTLKIDSSFVRAIDTNESEKKIVRALVSLAHDLGLDVVAEGVETEAVRELLAVMGCDYAQGHLFSAPLSMAETEALIANLATGVEAKTA